MRIAVASIGVGGWYPKGIARLDRSLTAVGFTGERRLSTRWPEGCPAHQTIPYGFKPWAAQNAAAAGIDVLIWLDASIVVAQPLEPLVKRIQDVGALFVLDGALVGAWTNDRTLEHFGVSRDDAMSWQVVMGGCFGLDLRQSAIKAFVAAWWQAAVDGWFAGRWTNDARTESQDPRCRGHRHDQSVASILVRQMELPGASHGLVHYAESRSAADAPFVVMGPRGCE